MYIYIYIYMYLYDIKALFVAAVLKLLEHHLQKSSNPLRVGNALEDLNLSRPSPSGASHVPTSCPSVAPSKWLAPRVTAPTGQLLHAVCPSSSLSTGMLFTRGWWIARGVSRVVRTGMHISLTVQKMVQKTALTGIDVRDDLLLWGR